MAVKGKGRTSKHYKKNSASYKKKLAYDRDYNKGRKKYLSKLNKRRRKAIKKGIDTSKKDFDHSTGEWIDAIKNVSKDKPTGKRGKSKRHAKHKEKRIPKKPKKS